jgi:hypothetical protein
MRAALSDSTLERDHAVRITLEVVNNSPDDVFYEDGMIRFDVIVKRNGQPVWAWTRTINTAIWHYSRHMRLAPGERIVETVEWNGQRCQESSRVDPGEYTIVGIWLVRLPHRTDPYRSERFGWLSPEQSILVR